MKKILVPVDFSEAASNAVRYTVELSASLLEPIELILLHVYEPPVPELGGAPASEYSLSEEVEQQKEQQLLGQLQAYARQYCRHSGIRSCLTMVTHGKLSHAIIVAAAQSSADLIVMGTKGAFGTTNFFMGTNTSHLIERASCPVLAVPELSPYRPVLKIVFATDLSRADVNDLREAAGLAETLNSQLQVVHISGLGEEATDPGRIVRFWSQVQQQVNYSWMEFISTEADEVAEGLEQFVLEHDADLLIVCPKKRSLFHYLQNGSTTRQLVIDALIPVLALPHTEEERRQFEEAEEALLLPSELAVF